MMSSALKRPGSVTRTASTRLHIAVESGYRYWREGVGPLVAANPVAVEGLDLDERLYPLFWSKLPGGPTALFQSIQVKPGLFDRRLEN
jgi:hypothetical protein